MGACFIQKVCLIKVPSETLKNLRGEVTGPKKSNNSYLGGTSKIQVSRVFMKKPKT